MNAKKGFNYLSALFQMLYANKPILSPNNERSLLSYLEICAAG